MYGKGMVRLGYELRGSLRSDLTSQECSSVRVLLKEVFLELVLDQLFHGSVTVLRLPFYKDVTSK